MSTPKIDFSIGMPPSWSEVDPHPRNRDASIATIIDEAFRDGPYLREQRAEIGAYLRATARAAWELESKYCGVFIDIYDDATIAGAVTVTILPAAPATGGSLLDDIAKHIADTASARTNGFWSRTLTVTLPHVGDAVRTSAVQPLELDKSGWIIPVVAMHTYVPFENGIALVACSSPAVNFPKLLLDLFDAVTEGFRFHREGDGT